MSESNSWKVSGIYFEACNCESVCPCYSALPPTEGFCDGNLAWHIQKGHYNNVQLDDLNVIMVEHCVGLMRDNKWKCWFYVDDRATDEQYDALKQIFTAAAGGHLAKVFGNLWEVQNVERARIEMEIDGWKHRASIPDKMGMTIGKLRTEVGPTLCRLPNIHGVAAIAEENWYEGTELKFNFKDKNALTTTFEYSSDS